MRPDEVVLPAGTGPSRFLHVTLSSSFLAQQLAQHFPSFAGGEFKRSYRSDLALHRLARAHEAGIDHGLSGQQLYFDQLRVAILSRLLLTFTRLAGHPEQIEKEGLAPFKTRRVAEFIEENLDPDLRLGTLADIAGTSKFHFSRAVARLCGFADHAHLTRMIKHNFGVPPSSINTVCGLKAQSPQSACPVFSIRR